MKLPLVLAVLGVARAADASCASIESAPLVLTPRDAKISADGGIVVGYGPKLPNVPSADPGGDPSVSSAFDATHEALAPGLTLYRPKPRGAKVALVAKGRTVVSFASTRDTAAPLPAPVVDRVEVHAAFRGPSTANAHLGADAPAAAVAIVMYGTGGAISYGLPSVARDLVVAEGGHCTFGPGHAPAKGEAVTFAWVDASGHVSPRSKPVTTVQIGKDFLE